MKTAPVKIFCGDDGIWKIGLLATCESRVLLDGKEVTHNEIARVDDGAILNIEGAGEFVCSCPDFDISDMNEEDALEDPNKDRKVAAAISSEFIAKEQEERVAMPIAHESGTQRAYRLNKALRRALCSTRTKEEKEAAAEREKKYTDRTAKRHELHGRKDNTDLMDQKAAQERLRDGLEIDKQYQRPKRKNIYEKSEVEKKAKLNDGSFEGESLGERPGLGFKG